MLIPTADMDINFVFMYVFIIIEIPINLASFYIVILYFLIILLFILLFYIMFLAVHRRRQWHPTPVLLPGKSQDRGAWWAAVYGVAQSRTRLKRLSSSSSRHSYFAIFT